MPILDGYKQQTMYNDLYYGQYKYGVYESNKITDLTGLPIDCKLDSLPHHPYASLAEIERRWVPCKDNMPIISWSTGCMDKATAMAMTHCNSLAENLKGTKMIVIDCDGDHDKDNIDEETVRFLSQWKNRTHCLEKEGGNSFHLTFKTDKLIPTQHFLKAHIDIIGNTMNSLRYLKTKRWNGLMPTELKAEDWDAIREYIRRRNG